MITKEVFTKIVNFLTTGAWVLMLGRGHIHISHYSKYTLFLLYEYTAHYLLYLYIGIIMLFLYAIVDFYLVNDGC